MSSMQFEKLQVDLQAFERISQWEQLSESIRSVFDAFVNHYHKNDIFFE